MQSAIATDSTPAQPGFIPDGGAFDTDTAGLECLGVGLPEDAERHLRLAGLSYANDAEALAHLEAAAKAAPGHAAVLIGFYRFYFYKGRLVESLEIGRECLKKAARELGLDEDWRKAKPGDADFSNFAAILPRFFLFTLKGYAYLHMRLGDLIEGRLAVEKLLELDPSDKVGAKVLMGVLERQIHGDEDDY